ncbi:MAG: hypothetical protein IKP66_09735 [Lachnospiraceae bacterium]|nr:hypothetical protein [Lachnospiraceae bacterium]
MGLTIDQELAEISDLALRIKDNYSSKLKAEKIAMLNNIKADIEQDAFKDVNGSKFIFVNRVNQIIDKYQTEMEEKE